MDNDNETKMADSLRRMRQELRKAIKVLANATNNDEGCPQCKLCLKSFDDDESGRCDLAWHLSRKHNQYIVWE